MKTEKAMQRAFGTDEYGFANIRGKVGNVKVSRFHNAQARGGCTICFPHGCDTNNSHDKNSQKNWKKHRANQWKV